MPRLELCLLGLSAAVDIDVLPLVALGARGETLPVRRLVVLEFLATESAPGQLLKRHSALLQVLP